MDTNPLENLKATPGEPVRERIFNELRKAIISGYCKPGAKLVERELASLIGASRTPVREALRKLELEGLVQWTAYGGVTVVGITEHDVDEIFDIRKVLEGLAAQVAARVATQEQIQVLAQTVEEIRAAASGGDGQDISLRFHSLVADISGYKRLKNLLNQYRDYAEAFRAVSVQNPGRQDAAAAEHRAVVVAIAQHAPEVARALMEQHLENARQTLLLGLFQYHNLAER